jgi:hypothetical protein
MVIILGNLLFFAVIIIAILIARGLQRIKVVDALHSENITYQQNISGKMLEFRENLATIMGSGLYDEDEYLNILMKHANYMIEFLEGLERGIKIEFLDDALEKPEMKEVSLVKTVAHFSSDGSEQ